MGGSPTASVAAGRRSWCSTTLSIPELPAAVVRLLDAIPELRLLFTSQVALGLVDEYRVPVETLDEDDAVALLEREAARRGVAVGSLAGEPDAAARRGLAVGRVAFGP